LNDVASEMAYPLVPQFLVSVLGGTRLQLGFIEGLAESISSLVKLWSGGRSDRVRSRKGLVVFGYTLAAVVRPLVGLLTAPWQLMAARTADRVGKGVRTSPRDALIADSTEPAIRGRAFGFHRAMDHLGAAIGPLLAAAFLWFWPESLRALFLLTAIPGIFVVLLLAWGLREERRPPDSAGAQPWTPSLKPFTRDFRTYLVALVVFTLGNSSDAFLLVRATELGVPNFALPLLWCAFHVAKSGGNLAGGRLVDRFGPRRLILLAWAFYAGIYFAFAVATQAWHVWLLFIGYAMYYALSEPAEKTLVAGLVPEQSRGLAFGWYHLAMGIAVLPASVLFGELYQALGPMVAFGSGSLLAFVAAAILLAVRESRQPSIDSGTPERA
jgi:MFS family permease